MLFTYEQKELEKLLKRFSHVVASEKSHIPTLSYVKVEVRDNQVIFTGTDNELTLIETVASNEGNKVGHCTFPVKSLLELVKNLSPTKPIKIELLDEKRLQVRQGRSRYALNTTDPTAFPSFNIPLEGFSPINPEALTDAINAVEYATSVDESRGALNGILLEPAEEGFMRAVASDGRRLASARVPGVIKRSLVISKRSSIAIKKIVPESEEASLLVNDQYLYITLDNSVLMLRLLGLPFPNYQAAFPQGGCHKIIIEKSDIISLLKRISLFAGNKVSASVQMLMSKDKLEFLVRDQKGDASEELKALEGSEIKGELEVQINPFFLQQSLEKFKGDKITVRIYSDLSPILLFDTENVMALVMPKKK